MRLDGAGETGLLDLHTHILPGVDDGSRSLKESEKMLKLARAAGVSEIVATPHLHDGGHEYMQRIRKAFALMNLRARSYDIDMYLGYEIMYDKLKGKDVEQYCFRWHKPVKAMLLEFRNTYPQDADMFLCACVDRGITPIIAHPERYKFIQDDINIASYLRGYGCLLQVDAGALVAPFYSRERQTASALIDAGWVDSICSDAHRTKHYRQLPKAIDGVGSIWRPFNLDYSISSYLSAQ